LCRIGSITCNTGLQKKIVLQQVEEAAAAGVDAAVIKKPINGRKQQSLAQLAKHDSMVDL